MRRIAKSWNLQPARVAARRARVEPRSGTSRRVAVVVDVRGPVVQVEAILSAQSANVVQPTPLLATARISPAIAAGSSRPDARRRRARSGSRSRRPAWRTAPTGCDAGASEPSGESPSIASRNASGRATTISADGGSAHRVVDDDAWAGSASARPSWLEEVPPVARIGDEHDRAGGLGIRQQVDLVGVVRSLRSRAGCRRAPPSADAGDRSITARANGRPNASSTYDHGRRGHTGPLRPAGDRHRPPTSRSAPSGRTARRRELVERHRRRGRRTRQHARCHEVVEELERDERRCGPDDGVDVGRRATRSTAASACSMRVTLVGGLRCRRPHRGPLRPR